MTLKLNGSTDGSVSIDAPADTSPTGSDITLTLPTTVGSAEQFLKNSGTAGELEFSSMVEDSSANIGVGITSPTKKLHVDSSSDQIRISDGSGGFELRGGNVFKISDDGSERLRIDADGHTHLGPRTGNNNATSFSDAIVNICGPDDIATSFSKAACYLHLGNNESTQNGVYPLGFGFTSADRTHVPAYIAYFTEDSAGAEHGPLIFATRDVTTDTAPSERLRILSNGYVQVQANGSGDCRLQFNGNGTRIHNTTSGGHIDFYTNNSVRNRFLYNGQGTAFSNQSRVYPETDNAVDLGSSGNRYDDVFATNGTIQTSDSRLKQEVQTSVLGIDFVKALRPVSYKWIEGKKVPIVDGTDDNGDNIYRTDADGNWVYESRDGARKHWGFIAQEVKQAVDDAGVDFAGWTLADIDDPDSTQSLRYEEFIAPLTKALQEAITKVETLETQNTAQQAQIDDLLARITALEAAE